MRFKLGLLLAASIISLYGCVAPQKMSSTPRTPALAPHAFESTPYNYSGNKSAAVNFQSRLDAVAWRCDLEASSGHSLYGMGIRTVIKTYGDSLNDCRAFARSEGDQAIQKLNEAKPSAKVLDLSKDLYAKWSTYLGSMSIYSPSDTAAKNQYDQAKSALLTEDKFSK